MLTTNVKTMNATRLRELIDETEETLKALQTELDKREQAEQNREIERLDVHFKNAEFSLQTIKDYVALVIEDLKKK